MLAGVDTRPMTPLAPKARRSGGTALVVAAALAVAALLASGAWIYASPWLAVSALRDAADRGDAAALERGVDFPALRATLAAELEARARSSATSAGGALLGSLAAGLAGPLARGAVDRLVTPEAVAGLLRGRAPELPGIGTGASTAAGPGAAITTGYDGRDAFVVTYAGGGATGRPWSIRFRRDGLATWRLVSVTLP